MFADALHYKYNNNTFIIEWIIRLSFSIERKTSKAITKTQPTTSLTWYNPL